MEASCCVGIVVKTAFSVVLTIIWWMVMIGFIACGAIHLQSCTVQPYIPIYMIVAGASSILGVTLTCTRQCCENICIILLSTGLSTLLHLFNFGWLIAGSVWIYSIYPPNYISGVLPYCHKTTYMFAFWLTTLTWILMALVCLCGCFFSVLGCATTINVGNSLTFSRQSFYGSIRGRTAAGDV